MIRILDRMVSRVFLKLFVLFVMGAPVIFVLGDITENLDDYLDRGLTGWEVTQAYLLQLPNFIMWSFPIAALVAVVFTVHGMTAHHEVVAAKAGGISFHRLVAPVFFWGVVLTLVGIWLAGVVPLANRRAGQLLRNEDTRREWRADFVFQSTDGQMLAIRRLTVADGRLSGVLMESTPVEEDAPLRHVVAEEAVYDSARGWTFVDGHMRMIYPDGEERDYAFQRFRPTGFTERPEELLEEPRDDEEMTREEMARLAEIIQRSGGEARELLVKREQRLAIPVATLVIILFGAPLATSAKRGGAAYGIGISLASTILYILLLRVAGAFGSSGTIPPLWAAWAPNALFCATGLLLLTRVRT